MTREMTCIICPNGCELSVALEGKDIKSITGAMCKKGEEYVKQEVNDPRRSIASLVKVKNGDMPLVSVRTSEPIPKDKIFAVMEEIKKIEIEAPVQIGQVIIENVLTLDVDIIATKSVDVDVQPIDRGIQEVATSMENTCRCCCS